jgi:glycosyltransferase involved in cell wall biosynthesis
VEDGKTGWLVEVDDERGFAAALGEALADPEERRRRGLLALAAVRARYSRPAIAGRFADCFAEVVSRDRSGQSAQGHGA